MKSDSDDSGAPEGGASQLTILYSMLAAVPVGRVVTYGDLAVLAGAPGAARWVGNVLAKLPQNSLLPWHRVVRADGRLGFDPSSERWQIQCQRLVSEGVQFQLQRVAMSKYRWPNDPR